MNPRIFLAWRYIRSPKSHAVIHWISRLSIVVTVVVTFAMVIVLSAFNGIQDLVGSFYEVFEAPYTLHGLKDAGEREALRRQLEEQYPGSKTFYVLETDGVLSFDDRQQLVVFKAVEESYLDELQLASKAAGTWLRDEAKGNWVFPGLGVKYQLGLPSAEQFFSPLKGMVYSGKKSRMNPSAALVSIPLQVGGYFAIGPDFDLKYVFCARTLLEGKNPKLKEQGWLEFWPGVLQPSDKKELQNLVGNSIEIRSLYDRFAFVFKTHRTEKQMTFLILLFVLFISLFNAVASVVMLILDKKRDVWVLKSMGLPFRDIRGIFYYQSLFMGLLGVFIGLLLGALFVVLQSVYGFIPFEGGIVDSYPVKLIFSDLALIAITVIVAILGFSAIPVRVFLGDKKLQA